MLTLIILIAIMISCIVTAKKCKSDGLAFAGAFVAAITGVFFIIHIVLMLTISYNYEMFVQKRDAFEQTLNNSRASGGEYETAAIVKRVSEWNEDLASQKYDNTTLLFNQYIDDRIEDLEPIR